MELKSLVLLGCRVGDHGRLSPPAERRALRAAAAFQQGLSPHLLLCGGKRWAGHREADELYDFLLRSGVPAGALERETWSRSTRENAHYAAQLLLPRGARQVGLVTCDFHMARALRCFQGAGFEPVPLPAQSPATSLGATWLRDARERASLALDTLMTAGFTSV